MKVYFEKIGYSNAKFESECNGELTYGWLYKQIKPYCMSHNLVFSYNEDTKRGTIFGGLRPIGKFEVKE